MMPDKTYSIWVVEPFMSHAQSEYVYTASDYSESLVPPHLVSMSFFVIGHTRIDSNWIYLCGSPYNFVFWMPHSYTYPTPGDFLGTILLVTNNFDFGNLLFESMKSHLHQYLSRKHFPIAIVSIPARSYQKNIDYHTKTVDADMIRTKFEVDIPIFEIDTLTKSDMQESLKKCYDYFQQHLDIETDPELNMLLDSEKILSTDELYEGRDCHWIIYVTSSRHISTEILDALSDKVCWHLRDDTKLLQWYGSRDIDENSRMYTFSIKNYGKDGAILKTAASLNIQIEDEELPPVEQAYLQIADYIQEKGIVVYVVTFTTAHPSPQYTWYEIMTVRYMIQEFGDIPFVLIDLNSDCNIPEVRKKLKISDDIPLLAGANEANLQQLYPLIEQETERKKTNKTEF